MLRRKGLIAGVALVTLVFAGCSGFGGSPPPQWRTGDGLRRDLQDVGFTFQLPLDAFDFDVSVSGPQWYGRMAGAAGSIPFVTIGADGDMPAYAAIYLDKETSAFGNRLPDAGYAMEVATSLGIPSQAMLSALALILRTDEGCGYWTLPGARVVATVSTSSDGSPLALVRAVPAWKGTLTPDSCTDMTSVQGFGPSGSPRGSALGPSVRP